MENGLHKGDLHYTVIDYTGTVIIPDTTISAGGIVNTMTGWTDAHLAVDENGRAHIVWTQDWGMIQFDEPDEPFEFWTEYGFVTDVFYSWYDAWSGCEPCRIFTTEGTASEPLSSVIDKLPPITQKGHTGPFIPGDELNEDDYGFSWVTQESQIHFGSGDPCSTDDCNANIEIICEEFGKVYYEKPIGMTHYQDDLLLITMDYNLYLLDTSGELTLLGYMDHGSKGLAFDDDGNLWSISAWDPYLYETDPADGSILSSVEITLDGETIYGGFGLATHPDTGIMYALVTMDTNQEYRELVTIDPITGVATSVGDTDEYLSGLAFGDDGTLYAVKYAGEGELFTLDTSDASATYIMDIMDGHQGVCFNPMDGLLYLIATYDQYFYTIDPSDLSVAVIVYDFYIGSPIGMTHDQDDELMVAMSNKLYTLSTSGDWTMVGFMEATSKGLAFDGDGKLWSVSPWDHSLREINPVNGSTLTNST